MPANVTVEFGKAQRKYEEAKTPAEKLAALQEMRSTAPSHKGAEKLRAEITKKMAAVRREMEKQKEQAKKKGSAPSMHVKKGGVGQIVLVGMPNSGKSTLLNALTGIGTPVSSYPFTTKKPVAGMMNYRNAKVQVVEAPAIIEGSAEGKANGTQVLSIVRNADAIVLVARNRGEEALLRKELRKAGIITNRERPAVEIRPNKFGGISISGKEHLRVGEGELCEFLKNLGMYNVEVIVREQADISSVAEAVDERLVYRRALVLNTAELGNIEELKGRLIVLMGKILIYTKKPGEDADLKEPMVLEAGSTVEAVARKLHKDFARKLRYVRVWGSSKFAGQRVSRNYELKNGDLIEVYGD